MAGKNQVIVKVHRRDLKVIDSDAKVAEMYEELRKEGKRDAKHCIPVKQIPDLEWEKEKTEPTKAEENSKNNTERRTGPTLRSSKCKQELNESKSKLKQSPVKTKNRFVQISLQLQALY